MSRASAAALSARAPQALPVVTLSESDGVRYLHLGSVWVQGAMRIRSPQKVELLYIQRMLAALLWLPVEGWVGGRAAQLGLGAGALTRFTARQLGMATTVVELNPQVVTANARWFHLPPEAEVVQGDAADWLRAAEAGSVRLLQVDLYDEEAAAPVIDSVDFYAACRRVLEEDGLLSINLFGREHRFERSIGHVAEAFGFAQVWSVQPTREGNTAVIASPRAAFPQGDEAALRATEIERRFGALGLQARRWLRMVRAYEPR